jgi:hypothetical protein
MKGVKVVLQVILGILMVPILLGLLSAVVWGVIWFLAARCDTGWTDVTRDPSFGDFAPVMGSWKTKVPLRLVEIKNDLHLVWGEAAIPRSKDLAMLPVGTEIRIEQLVYRQTFETSFLDARGSLTAGPHAGRPLVISDALFAPDLVFRACVWRGDKKVKETTWSVAADKLTK